MTEGQPDKDKLSSFLERDQRIRDKRLALLKGLSPKKIIEIYNKIAEQVEYLKNEYPNDYINHAVFHALIGSTIRGAHPNIKEDDFPGKGSVEKFIEDLEKEYPKETQE